MKRKKVIVSILVLCILLLVGVAVSFLLCGKKHQVPYIAFMENSTREDCLYICSDGNIYAAISEEAFTMTPEELERRIKENDYADILKFMGTTDASNVYRMHRLMCKVAIKGEYLLLDETIIEPDRDEYGEKKRYWNGYYYNEYGKVDVFGFYRSNSDVICSDKRAYKIVNWMYDCLKEYME